MQIKKTKWWIYVLAALVVIAVGAIVAAILWYQSQLKPYDESQKDSVRINIQEGATASDVGDLLEEREIIRSALAMSIYLRLNGTGSGFKTGVYSVSPSQSLPEVVDHLTSGKVDEKSIMFYPGAMVYDNSNKKPEQRTDVYTVLSKAGYDDAEIKQALQSADYHGLALKGRPASAGLEGYVYGETYFVAADATAQQVVQRAIDEFSSVVEKNDLEAKFAKQGLTLRQGITLASVVQREVSCHGKELCEDQRIVAQIFLKRLKEDMPLGADATFVYAANQDGKAPTVDYDSPYNTRVHKGLPPGPISAPGLGALLAVADPADTKYLYFVSGDDFKNHFAYTDEEHVANTKKYCQENCRLPQ